MQVRVLFFGVLKDLAGRSSEEVNLPEQASVSDLIGLYNSRISDLGRMLPSIAISVNQQYSSPDTLLKTGDEIAFLPPVSGGSRSAEQPGENLVRIVRGAIDTKEAVGTLKGPEDGAVVAFEGIVRNHTRGRRTLFLEYEAYEEMALKEMARLAGQACEQFHIRKAGLIHRLGRLGINETSVLIVVVSPHRAAAFEACRWLIDTLKKTVPIWKKEHFADGAVWADGEPFPEQLTAGTISRGLASK
jgi:molybdopterin synthase catalytic subunit